jgi:hypothetical protein
MNAARSWTAGVSPAHVGAAEPALPARTPAVQEVSPRFDCVDGP